MRKGLPIILTLSMILSGLTGCTMSSGRDKMETGEIIYLTKDNLNEPGNPHPLAYFFTASNKSSYNPDEAIRFLNCSAGADKYLWDFGDGTVSYEKEPVHVYETSGTYTVRLTASSGNISHTASGLFEIAFSKQAMIQALVDDYQGAILYPGISVAVWNHSDNEIITAVAGYSYGKIRLSEYMLQGGPTSPMTAAICLRMFEEGIIHPGDPVGKYLDPIRYVDPRITIRQLLYFQSGLFPLRKSKEQDALRNADRFHYWTREEIFSYLEEPYAGPGETTYLSFTNTQLLGYLLEKASGKTFTELLHHYVITPLELEDTYMGLTDVFDWERLADSYATSEYRNYIAPADFSFMFSICGTVSTAADLVTVVHAMFNTDYLSAGSRRMLLTKYPFENDTVWSAAPGFLWYEPNHVYEMGRWAVSGYQGCCSYFPENQTSVVILSNDFSDHERQQKLSRDIADLY